MKIIALTIAQYIVMMINFFAPILHYQMGVQHQDIALDYIGMIAAPWHQKVKVVHMLVHRMKCHATNQMKLKVVMT